MQHWVRVLLPSPATWRQMMARILPATGLPEARTSAHLTSADGSASPAIEVAETLAEKCSPPPRLDVVLRRRGEVPCRPSLPLSSMGPDRSLRHPTRSGRPFERLAAAEAGEVPLVRPLTDTGTRNPPRIGPSPPNNQLTGRRGFLQMSTPASTENQHRRPGPLQHWFG